MSMISARIERLPFARFHVHLLLMGGLGYLFDAMDAAVLAFILPVLRTAWGLTNVETGVLGSSTFVGYLFGALLAGTLGDLIGRRAVMMSALALYSAASLVSAAVDSWPAFFAARVVAGMGTGAESAIIAPYLAEFVARRYRGAFTGALAGFFSFGFVAAALLGYFIVPAYENGWRIVLVITAIPVVMLLWWRRSLPESPRWLESRGRAKEAEAVLDRIEAGFAREGRALPPAVAEPAAPVASSGTLVSNFAALLAGRQARITTMTWIMWLSITFSYYSFFVWIPGLLVQNGMSISKSFGYSLAMYCAQVPGYFTAAFFNERIGRQATIATYMLLRRRQRARARLCQERCGDHGGRPAAVVLHERHLCRRLCLHGRSVSDIDPDHGGGARIRDRPDRRDRSADPGRLPLSEFRLCRCVRRHHVRSPDWRADRRADGRADARPVAGRHRKRSRVIIRATR
ncbi:putative MFS transporter [Bradyrhizobium elkanii]|nr:putative MFS transporter [Bradyrhizobium elkanii]